MLEMSAYELEYRIVLRRIASNPRALKNVTNSQHPLTQFVFRWPELREWRRMNSIERNLPTLPNASSLVIDAAKSNPSTVCPSPRVWKFLSLNGCHLGSLQHGRK